MTNYNSNVGTTSRNVSCPQNQDKLNFGRYITSNAARYFANKIKRPENLVLGLKVDSRRVKYDTSKKGLQRTTSAANNLTKTSIKTRTQCPVTPIKEYNSKKKETHKEIVMSKNNNNVFNARSASTEPGIVLTDPSALNKLAQERV